MIEGMVESACTAVGRTVGDWINDAGSVVGGPDWSGNCEPDQEYDNDPSQQRAIDRYLEDRQQANVVKPENLVLDPVLVSSIDSNIPPQLAANSGRKT
jgi:hypothetical protein